MSHIARNAASDTSNDVETLFLPVQHRSGSIRSRTPGFAPWKQRRWKIAGITAVILLVMIILPLSTITNSLWSGKRLRPDDSGSHDSDGSKPRERSSSMDFDELARHAAQGWPRQSTVKIFHQQAVAADVAQCSVVGNQILQAGGSAADAVIAAALCSGVVHPYSSGIGGGSLMVYYNRSEKHVYTIDAREVAPGLATEDMFVNVENKSISSLFGWHAIAVPGELMGMWTLHKTSGRLPWRDLFQPAIKLAREGMRVTEFFARILAFNRKYLLKSFADPQMKRLLINETTGDTYAEGDVIYMPALAETLETIANDPEGIHEFYHGSIAKKLVADIKAGGGIMRLDDLFNYKAEVREAIQSKLSCNSTIYGAPPPSGNAILHYIFNIFKEYKYNQTWDSLSEDQKALFYHRLTEALKFGYAQRMHLTDGKFVPNLSRVMKTLLSAEFGEQTRRKIKDGVTSNDPVYYGTEMNLGESGGTAHISVVDRDGNAVAYSTSINLIFGSYRISKSTGIILNNHMNDFTVTGDQNAPGGMFRDIVNKIEPGKRPQSSMCPLIILDASGDVKMVAGGSGATRIISGLVNVLARILFFKQDLKTALDMPRLHHQLIPMELEVEKKFDQNHWESLKSKGHTVVESSSPYQYTYSAVEVIVVKKDEGEIHAVSDGRKGGLPDGI